VNPVGFLRFLYLPQYTSGFSASDSHTPAVEFLSSILDASEVKNPCVSPVVYARKKSYVPSYLKERLEKIIIRFLKPSGFNPF